MAEIPRAMHLIDWPLRKPEILALTTRNGELCILNNDLHQGLFGLLRASFKDFSVEGPTTKGTSTRKGKMDMCGLFGGGSGVPRPENFGIFELPRLDFLQFQHDFPSFSNKKGLLLVGQKPKTTTRYQRQNNTFCDLCCLPSSIL